MSPSLRFMIALLCSLASLARGNSTVARVVGVHDGDTVTALTNDNKTLKVRLAGIDAPELGQPFGRSSKQWLSDQIFGRSVEVTWSEMDRDRRIIAVIAFAGRDINVESVSAGQSWWYREYAPRDSVLSQAESEARAAHRGLWSSGLPPIAPWEWRSAKREGRGAGPGDTDQARTPLTNQGTRRLGADTISSYLFSLALPLVTLLPWYWIERLGGVSGERVGVLSAGLLLSAPLTAVLAYIAVHSATLALAAVGLHLFLTVIVRALASKSSGF